MFSPEFVTSATAVDGSLVVGLRLNWYPLKAPADGPQVLRVSFTAAAAPGAWWNGKPVSWKSQPGTGGAISHSAELPANAGASGLLSLTVAGEGTLSLDWVRAR